jgi:hypothetical protein
MLWNRTSTLPISGQQDELHDNIADTDLVSIGEIGLVIEDIISIQPSAIHRVLIGDPDLQAALVVVDIDICVISRDSGIGKLDITVFSASQTGSAHAQRPEDPVGVGREAHKEAGQG